MFGDALVLFTVLAVASGQSTNVVPCTHNSGDLPLGLYIEGCVDPPCQFPQLTDAVMHAVFRVPRLVTSMETMAWAYLTVGPITVPIPYPLGSDGITCNFLTNTYCPLIPNEIVQYRFAMHIESIFPVGTVAGLELMVQDQDSQPLFCFRTTISILPPNTRSDDDQLARHNLTLSFKG